MNKSEILLHATATGDNDNTVLSEANYDENLVPKYELPPILQLSDGITSVNTIHLWQKRRAEILQLFRGSMYGFCPEMNYEKTSCCKTTKIIKEDKYALNGMATRREIEVIVTGPSGSIKRWIVLLHVPNIKRKDDDNNKQVPCFLGLNFAGNHAIHPDPNITYQNVVTGEEYFICERGGRARKWQVEKVISRGFALATVYSGDIEPDNPITAFDDGVHDLFTNYERESWGTIAAWSWGLSRTLDVLIENVPEIDGKKVIVIGHSRKGKAALWAGAEDTRFAMVISNQSGLAGAAISRRRYGETFELMHKRFPTWTCANNKNYKTEDELPVDQHQLLALIAPRPIYVGSAIDDKWEDPKGEFLSIKYAEEVYIKCFGLSGLDCPDIDAMEMSPLDKPVHGPKSVMGYHCRSGDHDILAYDWNQYLSFAERHFFNIPDDQINVSKKF